MNMNTLKPNPFSEFVDDDHKEAVRQEKERQRQLVQMEKEYVDLKIKEKEDKYKREERLERKMRIMLKHFVNNSIYTDEELEDARYMLHCLDNCFDISVRDLNFDNRLRSHLRSHPSMKYEEWILLCYSKNQVGENKHDFTVLSDNVGIHKVSYHGKAGEYII